MVKRLVVLGLGSNLGDRLCNLRAARMLLRHLSGETEVAASPVYETEPVDVPDQYRHLKFLNAVLVFESDLSAQAWLRIGREVENRLGRVRTGARNEPRVIDVDLLLYGRERIYNSDLKVPHPRLAERDFVLKPLADALPDMVLPGERRPVSEMVAAREPVAGLQLFAMRWEPEG